MFTITIGIVLSSQGTGARVPILVDMFLTRLVVGVIGFGPSATDGKVRDVPNFGEVSVRDVLVRHKEEEESALSLRPETFIDILDLRAKVSEIKRLQKNVISILRGK